MKQQPTERQKIFANHISDKALISKNYKGLTHLMTEKKQIIQLKMGKGLNRHFSK